MKILSTPRFGKKVSLLVIGAGTGGKLIQSIIHEQNLNYEIKGFVDDDSQKIGGTLKGTSIYGPTKNLKEICSLVKPEEIVIAIPSVEGTFVRKIFDQVRQEKIPIHILPGYYENINYLEKGTVDYSQVRPLNIEDFFRKRPVKTNFKKQREKLDGKTILVTGAAGSIGSELCRQLLQYKVKKVIGVDIAETNLHNTSLELKKTSFLPVMGDIKDKKKMEKLFSLHQPEVVFHAAAYKHVPVLEKNPDESIKTNILGTEILRDVSIRHNVENFVNISTDKAVNPECIMGASKRFNELLLQQNTSPTNFISVRFGNVMGSDGSVVPLFKKQIAQGGPITITHPEVKRYLMTIPEAVYLVLQAYTIGKNKDLFILDMGEQFKIKFLADLMVQLEGYMPGKDISYKFIGLRPGEKMEDIEFKFIGLRPGEKMEENLTKESEEMFPTENPRIYKIKTPLVKPERITSCLEEIKQELYSYNLEQFDAALQQVIPEYKSSKKGLEIQT